jgi:hypothetical protein
MGFTPQQVDRMSLWQWLAAYNGYVASQSPDGGQRLSDSEADELFAWLDTGPPGLRQLQTQTYRFDDAGQLVAAGIVTFTLNQD